MWFMAFALRGLRLFSSCLEAAQLVSLATDGQDLCRKGLEVPTSAEVVLTEMQQRRSFRIRDTPLAMRKASEKIERASKSVLGECLTASQALC